MLNVFKGFLHTILVVVFIFVAIFNEWDDRIVTAIIITYTIVFVFGRLFFFLPKYLKKRQLANKYFIELVRKRIENNDDFDAELFESDKVQVILSKVYLSFEFDFEDYDLTQNEKAIIQYAIDYKQQILAGLEQIIKNNQIETSKKTTHK